MKHTLLIITALVLTFALGGCFVSIEGDLDTPDEVSVGNKETLGLTQGAETQTTAAQTPSVSEPSTPDLSVSELVLVDEAGVKITAKELEPNGFLGPELKLLIENNSGTNLTFQVRNASINGYMVETMMSVDVVNGKKANDSITFMNSDLDACGITTIADMEFSFHIFSTEDWDTYLDTDILRVETSAATAYTYTFDDSGDVVHDADGVKIVVKGLVQDSSIFGPGIVVYIANTGSDAVTVQVRDVSVNGFMVDTMFSCDVMPGKHAIDQITFLESDLEENDISEITQIELSFHIFDAENWETITDTETVYITFE